MIRKKNLPRREILHQFLQYQICYMYVYTRTLCPQVIMVCWPSPGVPAQVGHSHLYKPSQDAAHPAVHPAQSALGWCYRAPLSVATPKKEGKETCPILWS